MSSISIYLALTGRPWSFVFHFLGLLCRICSLVVKIPGLRRVGDDEKGRKVEDGKDLDVHGRDWEAEGPCESEWSEMPVQIQKISMQFQTLVTEYHECKELVGQVHECVVEEEDKHDVGRCMDVVGHEGEFEDFSGTIVNGKDVIEGEKSKDGDGGEEVMGEKEHKPPDECWGSGDGEGLVLKENVPHVESATVGFIWDDVIKDPVQNAVDTEEKSEVKSHAECSAEGSDAGRNGDILVQTDSFEGNGGMFIEVHHEEIREIPSEEAYMKFSEDEDMLFSGDGDASVQEGEFGSNGNGDASVQDGEFGSNGDGDASVQDGEFGCNGDTVSGHPCSETIRMAEPTESEHVDMHGAEDKEEYCEGRGDEHSYEYDEDYDDEEHDFFIQKLQSEIKRLRGPNLSVIPEESESDLFDSNSWNSESEESSSPRGNPAEEYSPPFRTLEPEVEVSIEAFYDMYTEGMRYFDMLNYKQIYTMGLLQINHETLKSSKPPGVAKRLKKCISSKNKSVDGEDLMLRLQQGIETVYVGHTCSSWEALHWQYRKFQEMVLSGQEQDMFYDYVADQFQQFQVMLQRFLENEMFEGPRVLNYVKNRCVLRSFLQVPAVKGSIKSEMLGSVTAKQMVNILEESIIIFSDFVRADKEKSRMQNQFLSFLSKHQELEDPSNAALLHAVKKHLHFKELKVRELQRRGRCIIKRLDPRTGEGLEILMALVDIKLVSRVLNMSRITSDHLQWCQKKLNRLSVSHGKVHRGSSTVLFPQ